MPPNGKISPVSLNVAEPPISPPPVLAPNGHGGGEV